MALNERGPIQYQHALSAWLAVAAAYVVVPFIVAQTSADFCLRMPLLVTYLVLLASVFAGGRLVEAGIRSRMGGHMLIGLFGVVAFGTLLYSMIGRCPGD